MGSENWPFIGTRGNHLRRLLAQAAEPALEQIRRDHDRPQPIYPLHEAFRHLEEHLFSVELRVERLFQVTRVKASKAFQSFQAITGVTPKVYIEERRLETAAGLLLLDQTLPLDIVAAAVGYSTTDGFRRAFHPWAGQLPSQFRTNIWKHKSLGARGPQPCWFTSGWLARFEAGTLEPEQRRAVIEWLRTAYGVGPSAAGAALKRTERERSERPWAKAWWRLVRCMPVETQRSLVVSAPFETTAFFEHLCEQSREEGRDDRQRGVQVAQLALAALEPLRKHIPEPALSHWQGKGWACLGNAHCQALDYESAESALATTERFLAAGEPSVELSAELLFYRSLLRCGQQRLAEALELAEKALELLKGRMGRLISQVFMTRARVYAHLGQAERALPDLHAALEVLDTPNEPFLTWMVHQNLASALWRLGRLEEAEQWLERSRPLAASLGKLGPWCHTVWLEGLLAAGRGRLDRATARMREACEGLRGIGEWAEFAVAALDLARLEERRGEGAEAMRWAAQALPHLEVLRMEREGQAALALLRRELAMKQLSAAVLEQLRRSAGRAVGAPELMEDKKT